MLSFDPDKDMLIWRTNNPYSSDLFNCDVCNAVSPTVVCGNHEYVSRCINSGRLAGNNVFTIWKSW